MFLKIYIFPNLFISTIMSISSNSWFSIWMMMEFNLMTFIPLLIYFNKFYKEISFKYFIVQAISSSMLLLMSNSLMLNLNYNFMMISLLMFINLSIFIKLGMAPFHFWFINIMKNLNWLNCLILSTWQKIIPTIILSYIFINKMNYFIIINSSLLSMMSLNHQSIRIIMSFSSINHMSWIIMNMMISEFMWVMYFLSYMIINMSLMLMFNKMKIFYINQIFILNNYKINKIFLFLNLISIMGLPPMFGFLMKWMSIYFINWNQSFLIIIMMIIMSIFMFFLYMRISISFMLLNSFENKLLLFNKFFNLNNMNLLIMMIINFMMNLWILSIWMI